MTPGNAPMIKLGRSSSARKEITLNRFCISNIPRVVLLMVNKKLTVVSRYLSVLRLPGEGLISTTVGVGGGGGLTPRPISHTPGKITLTIHELTYENRFVLFLMKVKIII